MPAGDSPATARPPAGFSKYTYRTGRATTTIIAEMDPEIVRGIEAKLTEQLGRPVSVPAIFGSAELASLIQKGNRAGVPGHVHGALSLAAALWEVAGLLFEENARETQSTSNWQSVTTFLFGRIMISMFEDSAASGEAVGAATALAVHLMTAWKPKPTGDLATVIGWLKARNAVILDGIRRLAAVALLTPRRFRAASLACCSTGGGDSVPWPKPGVRLARAVTDLPPNVAFDPAKSYGKNCKALLRVAADAVRTNPAVDPDTRNTLKELLFAAKALAGCYSAEELKKLPTAERQLIKINERNEPHIFVWYALVVCLDPALWPPPGCMRLRPPAELNPAPGLSVNLALRFLDQHCGGVYKALGFHPAKTMGDGNDIHARDQPTDAAEIRKWLAARHSHYMAHRELANAAKLEAARAGKSTNRKRPSPSPEAEAEAGPAGAPAGPAGPAGPADPQAAGGGRAVKFRRVSSWPEPLVLSDASAVPGQRSTHSGASVSAEAEFGRGLVAGRPDELCWRKGPYPDEESARRILDRENMLFQYTETPQGAIAKNDGPGVWIIYPHVGWCSPELRRGGPIPQTLERWTSKSGQPKEQNVVDWRSPHIAGVSMSAVLNRAAVRCGDFNPAEMGDILYEYLVILLARAMCGIGDNAPRNTLLDLREMPDNLLAGIPSAARIECIVSWWKRSPKMVAIDFDKGVNTASASKIFATVEEMWNVAVAKKHNAAVTAALLDVLEARHKDLEKRFFNSCVPGSLVSSGPGQTHMRNRSLLRRLLVQRSNEILPAPAAAPAPALAAGPAPAPAPAELSSAFEELRREEEMEAEDRRVDQEAYCTTLHRQNSDEI